MRNTMRLNEKSVLTVSLNNLEEFGVSDISGIVFHSTFDEQMRPNSFSELLKYGMFILDNGALTALHACAVLHSFRAMAWSWGM
jgi:hypothetical protein